MIIVNIDHRLSIIRKHQASESLSCLIDRDWATFVIFNVYNKMSVGDVEDSV